ncbi:MAG: energy-coupling factor transporter transmembrane protein EcfT, partial [Atopobiaceae bacterium]|nr:energy-coupling factor transporter transmembrane protein EcfT [Atopobiaceae bacterium]
MDRAAFQTFHPAVPAILFAGIIALTMFGLEPRLVGASLVSAILFALATQGVAAALDKLRWQLPLLILI